jgi:hypothetical protein
MAFLQRASMLRDSVRACCLKNLSVEELGKLIDGVHSAIEADSIESRNPFQYLETHAQASEIHVALTFGDRSLSLLVITGANDRACASVLRDARTTVDDGAVWIVRKVLEETEVICASEIYCYLVPVRLQDGVLDQRVDKTLCRLYVFKRYHEFIAYPLDDRTSGVCCQMVNTLDEPKYPPEPLFRRAILLHLRRFGQINECHDGRHCRRCDRPTNLLEVGDLLIPGCDELVDVFRFVHFPDAPNSSLARSP